MELMGIRYPLRQRQVCVLCGILRDLRQQPSKVLYATTSHLCIVATWLSSHLQRCCWGKVSHRPSFDHLTLTPRAYATHGTHVLVYTPGLAVGAVALAVYLATAAPGIPGGDAGEVVAESCHLGTAHPPGYPLFTLLNHVTTRGLPRLLDAVGLRPGAGVDGRASPAWCANATTSVMGALAVVFTAQTTHLLLCAGWRGRAGSGGEDLQQPPAVGQKQAQNPVTLYPSKCLRTQSWWWNKRDDGAALLRELASGCAALLMAFSPLTWQYSVTAEVFALNNFLLSLLCSLTVRFSLRRDLATAMGGALVSGLALSNQHTAVLYVAPLAGWVMLQLITSRCHQFNATQQSHQTPWRGLFQDTMALAGFFLLGLTPYAFLPLAAARAPKPGSWGNVATWRGFLHHLRRGDYGSLRLYSGRARGDGDGSQDCLKRLRTWLSDLSLVQGLRGVVPALAALGLLYLFFIAPPKGGGGGGGIESATVVASGAMSAPQKSCSSPDGHSCGLVVAPSSGSRNNTAPDKKGVDKRSSNASFVAPLPAAGKTKNTRTGRRGSARVEGDKGGNQKHKKQQQRQQKHVRAGIKPATTAGGMVGFLASRDDAGRSAPMALLVALAVYLFVFHWLSNMPLDDPLLFGVHARFWMQPNILVFVFCGVGIYWTFDLTRSVRAQRYCQLR